MSAVSSTARYLGKRVVYSLAVQSLFFACSIFICLVYIASTYQHSDRVWRPYQGVILVLFLIDFFAYLLTESLFNWIVIMDVLSFIPIFIEVIGAQSVIALNCLIFLRLHKVQHVCKVLRIFKIVKHGFNYSEREISSFRRFVCGLSETSIRVVEVLFNVIGFLCFLATIVYSISVYDSSAFLLITDKDMTWLTALYFVIVTVSTVGYGDIFAVSPTSRLVVILIILLAISFIPLQVTFIAQSILYKERTKPIGSRDTGRYDYVCIIGTVDFPFVKCLFLHLFHPMHSNKSVKVIFLSPLPACGEVASLLRLPQFKYACEFHIGSARSPVDLNRIEMYKCHSVIILNDSNEETSVALSCLSVCRFLDCTQWVRRPRLIANLIGTSQSKAMLKAFGVDVVLSRAEFKYSLLGLGAAVPGSLGIFFALMDSQSTFRLQGCGKLWHQYVNQFFDQLKYCVHQVRIDGSHYAPALLASRFTEAVLQVLVASEGKVILLGVGILDDAAAVIANPASNPYLRECKYILALGSSLAAVKDALNTAATSSYVCVEEYVVDLGNKAKSGNIDDGRKIAMEEKGFCLTPSLSSDKLSKLASVSSTFNSVECRLTASGVLDDIEHKDRVIVIVAAAVSALETIVAITCILRPIRSKFPRSQLIVMSRMAQDLVALSLQLNMSNVTFLSGDGRNMDTLTALHLSCSRCVLLLDLTATPKVETDRMFEDEPVISAALNVSFLVNTVPVICELRRDANTTFLRVRHFLLGELSQAWLEDSLSEVDSVGGYYPLQSAGLVLTQALLENILIQSVYNPGLLFFWETIINQDLLQRVKPSDALIGKLVYQVSKLLLRSTGVVLIGVYHKPPQSAHPIDTLLPLALIATACSNMTITAGDDLFIIAPSVFIR